MPEAPNPGIKVEYDLRDVLDGIRKEQAAGFAEMRTAMASKADKADVAEVQVRLDSHHREIEKLKEARQAELVRRETTEEHEGKFLTRGQRRWAAVYAVATLAVLTLVPILTTILSRH